MPRTLFDRLLLCALVLVTIGLVLVLASGTRSRSSTGNGTLDRALERSLRYQARIALIKEIYQPVELLRQEGAGQSALLKLAEIEKSYPGDAHGQILKGQIQAQLGALDEAIASYAAGVRLNGDYIERDNPLSQRNEIQQLVTDGLQRVGARLAQYPDNRSAQATLKELYYLQSRLAGGCE